jgi:type I restriction enzyme S subunit
MNGLIERGEGKDIRGVSQTAYIPVETLNLTFDRAPLPEGWRWVKLGDVCEVVTGSTPPKAELRFYGGTIAWIKPDDLDRAMYVDSSSEYLSNEGAKRARILPAGSVLVSCIGNVGKTAIAAKPLATNQQINSLIPREEVDSDYLFFACRFIGSTLRAAASVSLVPIINKSSFSALKIPLPSLPKQKRIAAILKEQMVAVEQARAAAEAQLKAAKDLPASYMRAVFNSPEANEWDKRRLGEVSEIVARQVDPKVPEYGALPHVNGENIESGTCRLKWLRTAAEDNMTSGKYLFEVGDVLYSKLRPYLRKVIVADVRGVCSADMYPIRVNPDFLNPHFTAWMLVSDLFTRYADEESRRARMPKLNREQLFAWEAPLPPLAMQEVIIENLSEQMAAAENFAIKLQDQLDSINKLPAALLRQAFTGKL